MTNKQDGDRSPFSFEERKELLIFAGIPSDKILIVNRQYNLQDVAPLLSNFDMNKDSLVFVVGKKDMLEDPRFKNFVKKDGTPTYLQPYTENIAGIQPAIHHGYLFVAPTFSFMVLNDIAKSASELRKLYKDTDPKFKKKFIVDLYGQYTPRIEKILDSKLTNKPLQEYLVEMVEGVSQKLLREQLKFAIKKIIKKIMLTEVKRSALEAVKTKEQLVRQRRAEEKEAKEVYNNTKKQPVQVGNQEDRQKKNAEVDKTEEKVRSAKNNVQAAQKELQAAKKMKQIDV